MFLYVKREPFYVIQSILESRMLQYGSEDNWWSIRPSFYKKLQNLTNVEQVAIQVIYTQNRIEEQLKTVSKDRFVEINYEDLLNHNAVLEEIGQVFELKRNKHKQEVSIFPKNELRCDELRQREITNAILFAEKYCRTDG